jgi:hypothetical protein
MRRDAAGLAVMMALAEWPDNASSANARSSADLNRAAGFFSRHRSTMRAIAGGILRSVVCRSDGSSLRIAVIASIAVLPANARRPDNISYRIAPNAKTSAR